MGGSESMRGLLQVGIRKAKSAHNRVVRQIVQRVSSEEREFRRVWSSIASIEGLLVSPVQEQWLFKTAKSLPEGATIVEIGSFKGRSTCCLAYGCKGTDKHIFAIDIFDIERNIDFKPEERFDGIFFDVFWHNIEKCGLAAYVTPIRGWSSEVAKTWDKPIDLLFIDGSHQYEDVLADFENFFPYVKVGGIVAFHDVVHTWPGPLRVWEEVASLLLTETDKCSTLAFGKKTLS
jgi:predicted O-methyltransferase YrrM